MKGYEKRPSFKIFFLKIKNTHCVPKSFSKKVSGLKIDMKEWYILSEQLKVFLSQKFFKELQYKTKSKNLMCPQ